MQIMAARTARMDSESLMVIFPFAEKHYDFVLGGACHTSCQLRANSSADTFALSSAPGIYSLMAQQNATAAPRL
jgi:hypothetical protein